MRARAHFKNRLRDKHLIFALDALQVGLQSIWWIAIATTIANPNPPIKVYPKQVGANQTIEQR